MTISTLAIHVKKKEEERATIKLTTHKIHHIYIIYIYKHTYETT